MEIVKPNYDTLLVESHRRWISERTATAGDAFDCILMASIAADPAADMPQS